MPWPTTHGLRTLKDGEADLIRGAIGMMVDTHVAELRENALPWTYQIEWFDQWDAGQRLWLLEQVTRSMLGSHIISEPAAVFDAAADAVFSELIDLVRIELDEASLPPSKRSLSPNRSWRQSIVSAFASQQRLSVGVEAEEQVFEVSANQWDELDTWIRQITRLADSILGVRLYRKAEAFRDGDYRLTAKFLEQRGLPASYLEMIPPLRTVDQTQLSIDRIQAYVFAE